MSGSVSRRLIELHWDVVWNKGAELIPEICAYPFMRHDPDSVTLLSHQQQI